MAATPAEPARWCGDAEGPQVERKPSTAELSGVCQWHPSRAGAYRFKLSRPRGGTPHAPMRVAPLPNAPNLTWSWRRDTLGHATHRPTARDPAGRDSL